MGDNGLLRSGLILWEICSEDPAIQISSEAWSSENQAATPGTDSERMSHACRDKSVRIGSVSQALVLVGKIRSVVMEN